MPLGAVGTEADVGGESDVLEDAEVCPELVQADARTAPTMDAASHRRSGTELTPAILRRSTFRSTDLALTRPPGRPC